MESFLAMLKVRREAVETDGTTTRVRVKIASITITSQGIHVAEVTLRMSVGRIFYCSCVGHFKSNKKECEKRNACQ